MIGSPRADSWFFGDAGLAIRELLAGLNPRTGDGAERGRQARTPLQGEISARAGKSAAAAPAILSCLDDNTVVACDTSMLCYNAIVPMRWARTPRSCLNPTTYATLGYALPAGIGAKIAQPDRRVV